MLMIERMKGSPAYFRLRAEEARIAATELRWAFARDAMIRIAMDYEHLADVVERFEPKGQHTSKP